VRVLSVRDFGISPSLAPRLHGARLVLLPHTAQRGRDTVRDARHEPSHGRATGGRQRWFVNGCFRSRGGSAAAPVGGGDSAAVEASSTPLHTGHSPTTGIRHPTVPERKPDMAGRLPGDPGATHTTPLDGQLPSGALAFAPLARSAVKPAILAASGPTDALCWADGGPPLRSGIAPSGRSSRGGRAEEALPTVSSVGPFQPMQMAQRLRDAAEDMSSAASDTGAFGGRAAGHRELAAWDRVGHSPASGDPPADAWRADRRTDKLPAAATGIFVATPSRGVSRLRYSGGAPDQPSPGFRGRAGPEPTGTRQQELSA